MTVNDPEKLELTENYKSTLISDIKAAIKANKLSPQKVVLINYTGMTSNNYFYQIMDLLKQNGYQTPYFNYGPTAPFKGVVFGSGPDVGDTTLSLVLGVGRP